MASALDCARYALTLSTLQGSLDKHPRALVEFIIAFEMLVGDDCPDSSAATEDTEIVRVETNVENVKRFFWTATDIDSLRQWIQGTFGSRVDASLIDWSLATAVLPTCSPSQIKSFYQNNLDTSVRRDDFDPDERNTFVQVFRRVGEDWAEISR